MGQSAVAIQNINSQPMPMAEFYRLVYRHDWFYFWADDSHSFNRGEKEKNELKRLASQGTAVHRWLLADMSKAIATGRDRNGPQHPVPSAPARLSLFELITMRVDLAKHEIANRCGFRDPKGEAALVDAVNKIRCQGAYFGTEEVPGLIAGHPALLAAWKQGIAEVEAIGDMVAL
jgi:hypothetical protein